MSRRSSVETLARPHSYHRLPGLDRHTPSHYQRQFRTRPRRLSCRQDPQSLQRVAVDFTTQAYRESSEIGGSTYK
jgi:hypothetical protein